MVRPTRYTEAMVQDYVARGIWQPLTFYQVWDGNAQRFPHQVAVLDQTHHLTWAQARDWTDGVAACLARLLPRESLLMVQLPNSVELVLFRVACEKAGVICLPAMASLRAHEVKQSLSRTGAQAWVLPGKVADRDYFELFAEIKSELPRLKHGLALASPAPPGILSLPDMLSSPPPEEDKQSWKPRSFSAFETSLVLSTTGSTGFPKFVEYTACGRILHGRGIGSALHLQPDDVVMAVGPGAAGPNSVVYFAAPLTGSAVAMLARVDAEAALAFMERERVTVAGVTPTHLAMMLQASPQKHDLRSLRAFFCGGAPLSYELGRRAEEAFGCPILSGYGGVDCGAACLHSLETPPQLRLATVGRPASGCQVKIVDDLGRELPPGQVGEVWMWGPSTAVGYFRDEVATREAWDGDGWFKMGDLGILDREGYLQIVGRKKDIIIRGGQNIYPAEVENLLMTHPQVSSVAIVAMLDPVMGEKACAYVVPKPGQDFTFPEMVAYLRERQVASYKLPERLEIIPQMPLVGEQKMDKRSLQADIAHKLRQEGVIP